ncbi:hypothetical protein ACIRG5_42315 [Lentzea sp. NPDC102401]|uniref:hypothetical protein n=1 Tax=Lentzea sp. NPDC102401 TaxID=3364128 RepID=UPI0037F66FF8
MAANSTTERTIKTKLDGESTGGLRRAVREQERELERLRKAAEKEQGLFVAATTKGADKVASALASSATGVLKLGSAVGTLQSAGSAVAGTVAVVGSLSGSLLALPGIAATGAVGIGVLKLATSGFGDALEASSPEEWTEATKKMAPAAVKTAEAIRAQSDRLAALKKLVQGRFFAGFDTDVRDLAERYFPLLEKGTGDIAGNFNLMGRNASKALLAPSSVEAVNKILGATTKTTKELEPALGNVLGGLLELGGVGAQRTVTLGKAVANLTGDFREWVAEGVKTGRINDLIDEGVDTAKDLGRVFTNVGQIGGKFWKGLNDGERDFLEGIEESTQAIEDFLDSAEGQQAIKVLGDTLRTTADVARNVLRSALEQVGPLIRDLGPAAQGFAQGVGQFLVNAIETAGPLLQGMARFLSENKDVIQALTPVVLGLVVAYKGMQVLNQVKTWGAGIPAMFGDIEKKANSAGDAVGDPKSGKGIAGKLGQLQGLSAAGFTIGSLLTIDAATNKGLSDALNSLSGFPTAAERAKEGLGEDFWSQLFEAPAAKPGDRNDIRNWVGDSNFWQVEKDKIAKNRSSGIKLEVTADTFAAQLDLNKLINSVNKSSGTVNINGNNNGAGFALRTVLEEIAAGKATVMIDGQAMPAQDALNKIIEQINIGTGTVELNGNTVPAGQALQQILGQIGRSGANLNVGANTSGAQGVIDNFIRMNNGKTIQIYTSVNGSGGIASAGRLATGGRPFFNGKVTGPGSRTNDRAGLFALSRDEHVLTAAEVDAAGGHGAIYAWRRALLSGARGFAEGGTPRALSASLAQGSSTAPSISVGSPAVSVFIDGREFRGMVRAEIDASNRGTRRAAAAGTGRGW